MEHPWSQARIVELSDGGGARHESFWDWIDSRIPDESFLLLDSIAVDPCRGSRRCARRRIPYLVHEMGPLNDLHPGRDTPVVLLRPRSEVRAIWILRSTPEALVDLSCNGRRVTGTQDLPRKGPDIDDATAY